MAYERNLLATPDQFLDRAREGIKSSREQDNFIGRKRRFLLVLELNVFCHGRRIDDRPELELVAVIGKEAQRLDERGQDGIGRPEAGQANWNLKPEFSTPPPSHLRIDLSPTRNRAVCGVDVAGDFQKIGENVRNVRQEPPADVRYLKVNVR